MEIRKKVIRMGKREVKMIVVPNQTKRRNHNYIDSRNIKMKADCHGLSMEAAVEGPLF